jgi:hypothetical protein
MTGARTKELLWNIPRLGNGFVSYVLLSVLWICENDYKTNNMTLEVKYFSIFLSRLIV